MAFGTLNVGVITPGSGATLTVNESVTGSAILDEDNLASNSATKLATQQSIKAYADSVASTASSATNALKTNSTITTLATVTAGNLSNSAIVYPTEIVFFGETNTTYTSTGTVIVWDVAVYDPQSGLSGGVYTIPKAGKYLIIATGKGNSGTHVASGTGIGVFKGSTEIDATAAIGYHSATQTRLQFTENIISLCAANDTITIKTYLEGPGNANNVHGGLLTISRIGV